MLEHELIDTASRIALENAAVLGPLIGLALLLAAQRRLGRWPDLWRVRRLVLPQLGKLHTGSYDDVLEPLDERTSVDLDAVADAVPEKTRLPLQEREFVGTIDAPPRVVREELRSMDRTYPNNLASIQFDVASTSEGGPRIYSVGSYALRPQGFLGTWQTHVRLTPTDGGRRTRLWAHRERNAWRQPVRHYRGDGWDAEAGVQEIASLFASDERFEPSAQAEELLGS